MRKKKFDHYFKIHGNELEKEGNFSPEYYNSHKVRFNELFDLIPHSDKNTQSFGIEIGATSFFLPLLGFHFGYSRVMGTIWSDKIDEKKYVKDFSLDGNTVKAEVISINLEHDLFPLEDESVNFILCSEVIEHMDIDPMFMIKEFNRLLKPGGQLLISTPNSCSARIFWGIANGYRPHFFMHYEKNRSPYRHNFEYDVGTLHRTLEAGGFNVLKSFTSNAFKDQLGNDDIINSEKGLKLLRENGLPDTNRGECIFMLVEKTSEVMERWPAEIYT